MILDSTFLDYAVFCGDLSLVQFFRWLKPPSSLTDVSQVIYKINPNTCMHIFEHLSGLTCK